MSNRGALHIGFGMLVGFLLASLVKPAFAQFESWAKTDVIAVVLVEPGIGGFRPVSGSGIGNTWSKSQVVPMCRVKPALGGFDPVDGSSIGNTWPKGQVRPMVFVVPSLGRFVPAE